MTGLLMSSGISESTSAEAVVVVSVHWHVGKSRALRIVLAPRRVWSETQAGSYHGWALQRLQVEPRSELPGAALEAENTASVMKTRLDITRMESRAFCTLFEPALNSDCYQTKFASWSFTTATLEHYLCQKLHLATICHALSQPLCESHPQRFS